MAESRPRRVLMTADTVGGVWTFTMELARELTREGVEVWVAAFGGKATETQRAEAESIKRLLLFDSTLKLEWMEDPWLDVAESQALVWSLNERFQPDVVHLSTYSHAALPWRVPVVLTAHSCVASWWASVRGETLPAEWGQYLETVQSAVKTVDVVVAPTGAMWTEFARHYQVKDIEQKVIHNGRSAEGFRSASKQPFVFAAGRLWDQAKNIEALDGVAASLPWDVFVAGDQRGLQLRNCKGLGLLSQKDLSDWYSRASIYALPARYEPFGLSVLEAALSGCALVLGNIPSLREVWGSSAIYVEPNDRYALQTAIARLIEDPAFRQAMASKAQLRAKDLSAASMAAEYLKVYSEVLQGRWACAS